MASRASRCRAQRLIHLRQLEGQRPGTVHTAQGEQRRPALRFPRPRPVRRRRGEGLLLLLGRPDGRMGSVVLRQIVGDTSQYRRVELRSGSAAEKEPGDRGGGLRCLQPCDQSCAGPEPRPRAEKHDECLVIRVKINPRLDLAQAKREGSMQLPGHDSVQDRPGNVAEMYVPGSAAWNCQSVFH